MLEENLPSVGFVARQLAPHHSSDSPIVRLVQLMISEAVQLRASDIHIEPFEDRVRIRYRIDEGLSIKYLVPPEVESYITEHNLYER
mgnify:CR=1 FL=1